MADTAATTGCCGRVNGIETKVSELPKSVVAVKPTGSVVAVTWALVKVAAPKRRATKLALDRADGLTMRTENLPELLLLKMTG